MEKFCGRWEGRIEGARRVKDTPRKPIALTNLGPWGLMEMELTECMNGKDYAFKTYAEVV